MAKAAAEIMNPIENAPDVDLTRWGRNWREFPYWLVGIVAVLAWILFLVFTDDTYRTAWDFILPGIWITITTTIYAFAIAVVIGLVAGLGRISRNVVFRNLATFYIEFIRGVPILVLIFTVAFSIVPAVSNSLGFANSAVDFKLRAIIALALIYGAYLGEVFRAGIESIPKGQMEAGRSLGMSHTQTMARVILPQAIRNITPALGNDAIAMLKDTSLLSVLAVREITQLSRIHVNRSFEYDQTFAVLVALYLAMTVTLSLLLSWYRRWLGLDNG